MLTSPPPPILGMAANTGVLTDVTSQSIQQNATAHTTGCRHHTACINRLNTQQITQAAKQPHLPSNQHTIQPTPPTTPHENTVHHRARHVTTTHYPTTQYNTPRHCTVQQTIANHTPQQTTTQHTTPLDTLRDHTIVMWCGRVSCGVVWCHVVWCGVAWWGIVPYGCLSGWLKGVLVAWHLGLFGSLGCLLGVWLGGARCVVCAPCGVRCRVLLCAV